MEVRKIKVGYLQTNCYILIEQGSCLIIDPGDQYYSIESQIGHNQILGVLITHRHPDHIGALEQIQKTYNPKIFEKSNLTEGKYEIGPFRFEVINTPGHTSDSVTFFFYDYNFMFTGDFLFQNSIGRTDMPTGNMDQMKESLEKIKEYSDRIRIYPGHGDTTNLGDEKQDNPFLRS